MIIRRLLVVGVIVATGIVAGSGVGAASPRGDVAASVRSSLLASKSKSKTLTKAQFIAKADALCDAARTAFVPVGQQFAGLKNSQPTPTEIASFVNAFSGVAQTQITKTEALKPPKADQATIKKFLQMNQAELAKVKADPSLLGGSQSPFLGADTIARAYGLEGAAGTKACTSGEQAGSGGNTSTTSTT